MFVVIMTTNILMLIWQKLFFQRKKIWGREMKGICNWLASLYTVVALPTYSCYKNLHFYLNVTITYSTHETDPMRLMSQSYSTHPPSLPYFFSMFSFKILENVKKTIFSGGIRRKNGFRNMRKKWVQEIFFYCIFKILY